MINTVEICPEIYVVGLSNYLYDNVDSYIEIYTSIFDDVKPEAEVKREVLKDLLLKYFKDQK